MRWLGLDWDEGPEVGGPHAPYLQSRAVRPLRRRRAPAARRPGAPTTATAPPRSSRRNARPAPRAEVTGLRRPLPRPHRRAGRRLRSRGPRAGAALPDARRRDHLHRPGPRRDHLPARARARLRARARQRPPALHAGQPGRRRADGDHPRAARRGPALLDARASSRSTRRSPRSASARADAARSGTCPTSWAQGNKKLSKRDPEANLLGYRERGFLPEGLLNYLALLGWAIAEDRDIFSLEEMVAAFDIERVNPNPARFDLKKAEAINAAHLRLLEPEDFTDADGAVPPGGRCARRPGRRRSSARCSTRAMPLVQERMTMLGRGRRHARLPVRRRASPSTRPTSPRLLDDGRARRSSRPPATALAGARRLDHRGDRGGAARRARRGARAQAAQRVRAGAGRDHRPPDLAAAVRVAGAARPRASRWPGSTPHRRRARAGLTMAVPAADAAAARDRTPQQPAASAAHPHPEPRATT